MGDRSGWCCHGYWVGAPCTKDHSFLLPSLDLGCALRWLPSSSSGEEKRGESDSGWGS